MQIVTDENVKTVLEFMEANIPAERFDWRYGMRSHKWQGSCGITSRKSLFAP